MTLIDKTGQGNTLLILTGEESRLIRQHLTNYSPTTAEVVAAHAAFNRGIARGTAKMAEESKAEWKARR